MAAKISHACVRCHCLVVGECGCHVRAKVRPTSATRGYDARWQKFRAWFLSRHPRCEDCWSRGIDNRKNLEVHHLERLKDARIKQFAEDNCLTLCQRCHARRTTRGE